MMTAEPHPQRCETCNSYERGSQWCSILKERICHLEYTLIERVGCASHSSAKSEREIREKVLAELSKWVNEHSWRNDAESVACVYSYALVQKMADLRTKQGKQGEQE